jgi:hypothetical protein
MPATPTATSRIIVLPTLQLVAFTLRARRTVDSGGTAGSRIGVGDGPLPSSPHAKGAIDPGLSRGALRGQQMGSKRLQRLHSAVRAALEQAVNAA